MLTIEQLLARVSQRSGDRLRAELRGPPATSIRSVAALLEAGSGQLAFLANPRYRSQLSQTRASAVVLRARDAADQPDRPACTWIVCEEPYAWFALAAQVLSPVEEVPPGIAATAVVDPGAQVDPTARLDDFVVVEAGARIGAGVVVGAGSYVGRDVLIGAQTRLMPGVRIMAGCEIGPRGIVHSGAVIGADGFGFAPLDGQYIKIPQTGRVLIGADVEIGANTTIDRGTMGDTTIDDGVKIDNQVQIGHNVRVGAHTVIAGCTGIAGSAVIGRHCQLGGASMIHGHISLADGVIVSGGTLISRSIVQPGFYSGPFPFMLNRDWERNAAVVRHVDDLRRRLRALEQQMKGAAAGGDES
jgi:UDP-3-O-[3-hydroxymyristoyl] glucosamine N-acyltransferase